MTRIEQAVAFHLMRRQSIERAIRRLNRRKTSAIGAADVAAEVLRKDADQPAIAPGSFDELRAAAADALRRRWQR